MSANRRPTSPIPAAFLLLAGAAALAACGGGGGSAPLPEDDTTYTVDVGDPPLSPSDPGGMPSEREASRATWEANRPDHYRYVLTRSSFAPPQLTAPVVVEVLGSVVVSRTDEQTGMPAVPGYASWWPDVDGLFDILQAAVDGNAASIQATYDAALGYPTSASIDYDAGLADEEVSWTARDLVALP